MPASRTLPATMQTLEYLTQYALFRHALITGVAVGMVCSLLSVIVVLKRMAFIGQGISHASFGGLGAAIFLGLVAGWAQDLLVLGFCVGSAVLIGVLSRRRGLEPDTAIGVLLAGAMALGVLLRDLSQVLRDHAWYARWFASDQVPASFEQLLFGSVLNVTYGQMWTAVAVGVVVIAVFALLFKEILFFTFDETVSQVFGVRSGLIYYLLLVLLSVTVVLSVRLVGVVLVSALLVIPGATAVLVSQRLGRVLLAALLVGVGGTVLGLVLSLQLGALSSGPSIVLVLCAIFGTVFAGRGLLNRRA